MAWTTPKMNWANGEYFNLTPDYDRIKGNIEYLTERATELFGEFEVTGLAVFYIQGYPTVSFFNNIVNDTMAIINACNCPVGTQAMRLYEQNGRAWNADDLNAIEGNHLVLYQAIEAASAMKTVAYTVRHVVNGLERTDLTQTYTEEVAAIDAHSITVQAGSLAQKTFTGYKYSTISPAVSEGSTVSNGTVITLEYVKDEAQTQRTWYKVVHRIGSTAKKTNTYYDTAWVNEENPMIAIQSGTLEGLTTLTGYKLGTISPKVAEGAEVSSGTTIYMDYVSDSAQTKTLKYTVRHSVNGSIQSAYSVTYHETVWINDPDTITVQAGSLAQKTFTGYKYSSVSPNVTEGGKVANNTVITLSYVKDTSQTKVVYYTHRIAFDGVVQSAYTRKYTKTVWVNDPDTIAVEWTVYDSLPQYNGYELASVSHNVRVGDTVPSGTVITAYYVTVAIDHTADLLENGFDSATYADTSAMTELCGKASNWDDPDLAYYLATWSAAKTKQVRLSPGEVINVPHKAFGPIPFVLVHKGHPTDSDEDTGLGLSLIAKDIVTCLAFDAKSDIYPKGNPMYEKSCLFQWLNSTAAQGKGWFVAAEDGDMPPTADYVVQNPYATAAGFLNGFDSEFLAVLMEVRKPYVFQQQTVYAPAAKVFIPSVDELFGGQYGDDYEGEQYDEFATDSELRIAYELGGKDEPWRYWTRTARDTASVMVIDEGGEASKGYTPFTGEIGVRPGIVLKGY